MSAMTLTLYTAQIELYVTGRVLCMRKWYIRIVEEIRFRNINLVHSQIEVYLKKCVGGVIHACHSIYTIFFCGVGLRP
jgi:hypothetical protein